MPLGLREELLGELRRGMERTDSKFLLACRDEPARRMAPMMLEVLIGDQL